MVTTQNPPPGDSHGDWASRKAMMTLGSLVAPFLAASTGWLVLGKMTADQWMAFCQWEIPIVLLVYAGANVAEKVLKRKV